MPGDTNGKADTFVKDVVTGATTRVSVDSAGNQGVGDSGVPAISADGRFVAFHSNAGNLAPGDNGKWHVYVHDRVTGTTSRVSVSSAGLAGNEDSFEASLSADGRYVAFRSRAGNLIVGDNNFRFDVFVHDRQTGETTRVSLTTAGGEGDLDSYRCSISGDGRYVAFQTNARNLAPGDGNFSSDVFVRDRVLGTTTWVSVDPAGNQGAAHSFNPSISADGRYVAFESWADNLIAGDTGVFDVFVRDLVLGVTTRVSVSSAGVPGNSTSTYASISADGRYVAFESYATNLVAGDTTTGFRDIFTHDRVTGVTTRVSVSSAGVQGSHESIFPSISADGRYTAYSSGGINLVVGDSNGQPDTFLRDNGMLSASTIITITSANEPTALDQLTFITQLRSASGEPLTGVHSLDFRIFDSAAGGALLWSAGNPAVNVSNVPGGYFQQSLLDLAPLSALPTPAFLAVTLDGATAPQRIRIDGPVITTSTASAELRNALVSSATRHGDDASYGLRILGNLRHTDGSPVVGVVNWQAALYGSATGGSPLFVEKGSLAADDAIGGAFGIALGFNTPLNLAMLTQTPNLWVGLSVNGQSFASRIRVDGGGVSTQSADFQLTPAQATRSFDIEPTNAYGADTLNVWTLLRDSQTGLPLSGNHQLQVGVFNAATGGGPLFLESANVTIADAVYGTYVHALGGAIAFDFDILRDHRDLWVELTLDGKPSSLPRTPLNTAPFIATAAFDVSPPRVSAASFLATGEAAFGATSLTVTFSEPVVGANATANYRLTRAGFDGVPGTADDVVVPITNATPAGNVVTLTFNSLIGGAHRLTVEDAIVDVAGLALDGDGNATAGGDWVRDFVVHPSTLTVMLFEPTSTGARFTLSQAAAIASGLNLYDYRDAGGTSVLGAADVQLVGPNGAVNGSLTVDATGASFVFVSTAGVLPPGAYSFTLRSAANGFRTPGGDLLDGDGDGTTGDNFVATFTVTAPAANAVTVSLPHFARGPEQAVNVPATSALGLPIQVSDGGGLNSLNFQLTFDPGLLDVTAVNLVGLGTASVSPISPGNVYVALAFASPLASGAQTVAHLIATVPTSAASRYGERGTLDISALLLNGSAVPGIDRDAVHVNAYFGDLGRNGRYDSFDVQQASRMAVRLDTGFQQHPMLDPTILADFNGNGRIDSFDVQQLSRLALRLPVTGVAALPSPAPTTTDTDRLTAEEPPKAEPAKTATAPRSDVDGNGAVDAQDVAWAIYYFNRSENGVVAEEAQGKKLDLNGDQLFDAADILLAITDLNTQLASAAEGENATSAAATNDTEEDLDALTYLLAEDLVASRRKK